MSRNATKIGFEIPSDVRNPRRTWAETLLRDLARGPDGCLMILLAQPSRAPGAPSSPPAVHPHATVAARNRSEARTGTAGLRSARRPDRPRDRPRYDVASSGDRDRRHVRSGGLLASGPAGYSKVRAALAHASADEVRPGVRPNGRTNVQPDGRTAHRAEQRDGAEQGHGRVGARLSRRAAGWAYGERAARRASAPQVRQTREPHITRDAAGPSRRGPRDEQATPEPETATTGGTRAGHGPDGRHSSRTRPQRTAFRSDTAPANGTQVRHGRSRRAPAPSSSRPRALGMATAGGTCAGRGDSTSSGRRRVGGQRDHAGQAAA